MSNTEEWRDVPDWEGIYQVSSFGRIRSLDKTISTRSRWGTPHVYQRPGKILKLIPDRDGYLKVSLVAAPRKTTAHVHKLVCAAFHGAAPTPNHTVAHGDGVRNHNTPDNLRWATMKENFGDRYKHGTAPVGEQSNTAKLTNDDVIAIRALAKKGIHQSKLADQFNVCGATISNVVTRRNWSHVA